LRQFSRHHRYTLTPPFQPGCAQLLSPQIPTLHGTFSTFPYFTPTACSKKASPLRDQFPILAHLLFWLAALPPSCLRHTSLLRSFSTVHANSAVPSSCSKISARLRTAALAHTPLSAWRYNDSFLQHLQPPATQLMVLRRPGTSSTPTQFIPTASNTSSTAAFPFPLQVSALIMTTPLFWLAAIPPSCLGHASLLRSHSTLVTSFQHFSQAANYANSCHHQQTQLCMALPSTFSNDCSLRQHR
jgi:hypothetical protein